MPPARRMVAAATALIAVASNCCRQVAAGALPPADAFVRCSDATNAVCKVGKVFFVDATTHTRHWVARCETCPGTAISTCSASYASPISAAALSAATTEGPPFTCGMLERFACANGAESDQLTLRCAPGGVITGVQFADYGQLNGGSCPGVKGSGSCGTDISEAVAAGCVGKPSCGVRCSHSAAETGGCCVEGQGTCCGCQITAGETSMPFLSLRDPCPDMPKSQAVQVTCGYHPSSTLFACGDGDDAATGSRKILGLFTAAKSVCCDDLREQCDASNPLPSTCNAVGCARAVDLVEMSCRATVAGDGFLRVAFQAAARRRGCGV